MKLNKLDFWKESEYLSDTRFLYEHGKKIHYNQEYDRFLKARKEALGKLYYINQMFLNVIPIPDEQINEFHKLVKAFEKAKIEYIEAVKKV